jgi:hypothetical protein
MIAHTTALWEEIHYYRRQILDYEAEDLLLRIIGQKPINKKRIADTEKRIDNLFWAMQDW